MNYFLKYAVHGKLVAGLIYFKRKSRPCASKVYIQFNENRKCLEQVKKILVSILVVSCHDHLKNLIALLNRQTPINRKYIQYSDLKNIF